MCPHANSQSSHSKIPATVTVSDSMRKFSSRIRKLMELELPEVITDKVRTFINTLAILQNYTVSEISPCSLEKEKNSTINKSLAFSIAWIYHVKYLVQWRNGKQLYADSSKLSYDFIKEYIENNSISLTDDWSIALEVLKFNGDFSAISFVTNELAKPYIVNFLIATEINNGCSTTRFVRAMIDNNHLNFKSDKASKDTIATILASECVCARQYTASLDSTSETTLSFPTTFCRTELFDLLSTGTKFSPDMCYTPAEYVICCATLAVSAYINYRPAIVELGNVLNKVYKSKSSYTRVPAICARYDSLFNHYLSSEDRETASKIINKIFVC